MLAICYVAGAVSWARAHWARAHGQRAEKIPGRKLLAAFFFLVLFQVLPLPPGLLGWLSPGSFAFHGPETGVLDGWRPVTVSTELTVRGLVFYVGMSLLFATTYREFGDPAWLRRLIFTIGLTGAFVTLVGLVQKASLDPGKIYGLWRPSFDYAVFGTYVNKNHYAGLMAMAMPVSLGLVLEAFERLSRAWSARRVSWLALGDEAGNAFVRRSALALLLTIGVLVSESRGGLLAALAGLAAITLARRRRVGLIVALAALIAASVVWVDLAPWTRHFQRSFEQSRLDLWRDQSHLVASFPMFGVGFNALGPAYRRIQTYDASFDYSQAHNEYLQVLLDTGLVGLAIFLTMLARLLRAAWRAASLGPLEIGLWGAIIGSAGSNLFDFNWQIPANAAVFVAIAAAGWRRSGAP